MEEQGYKIKKMDRDYKIVHTIHGVFEIKTNARTESSNAPLCYGCFYKHRKGKGAPCVTGSWCGGLHDYLEKI